MKENEELDGEREKLNEREVWKEEIFLMKEKKEG
jgi:hypothetical protein